MQAKLSSADARRLESQVPKLVLQIDREAKRTGQDPLQLARREMMVTARASGAYRRTLRPKDAQSLFRRLGKEIRRPEVVKRICAALTSESESAFDLAKTLSPALVGLALQGTLRVPLEPFVFAVIILYINKVGTAALCAGQKGDK